MWKMLSKGTLLGRECFGDAQEALIRTMKKETRRNCARDKGRMVRAVVTVRFPTFQIQESFYREKQNLIWDNRMIDNRLLQLHNSFRESTNHGNGGEEFIDISGGRPSLQKI